MSKDLLVIESILNELITNQETFMEEMVSSIINYVEKEYENSLLKKVDSNKNEFFICARKLNLKSDKNMQSAYYLGFIKATMDIKRQKDKLMREKIESNRIYLNDKVLNEIVEKLYHEEMLSILQVSKLLNISKEEIENNILSLINKKLVYYKVYNETNYFYLTSSGKSYFRNLCNKYNEEISTEKYTCFIMDILDTIYDVLETPTINKELQLLNIFESGNIVHITQPKLFNSKLNKIINKIDYVNANSFVDPPLPLDEKVIIKFDDIMFDCYQNNLR